MRKIDFMQTLERALTPLAVEERRDILADFEEHFASGQALGKSEEEVARELGDPQALAAQYVEPAPQVAATENTSVAQGIFAFLALLLFDAIIALPVLSVLFSLWVSLWVGAVSLLVGGMGGMVMALGPWLLDPSGLTRAGIFLLGMAALALSVLWGIGMVFVTKWCARGLMAFLRAHVRIVKGGSKQ